MSVTFIDVVIALGNSFVISLIVFVVTLLVGLPLGLPIAFCSMSKFAPLRYLSKTIVWIVRGVPLMLQIYMIYYLPGLLFDSQGFSAIERYFIDNYNFPYDGGLTHMLMINMGSLIAVLIAFSLNYACYFSEIYRGGIESISKGQYEAGYVLGLKKSQVFRKIVLKQVVKRIVPPMSNEIITLIKDTALANCIAVPEIIYRAREFQSTHQLVWPIFFAGLYYLIFVGALTLIFGRAEKKLDYFKS